MWFRVTPPSHPTPCPGHHGLVNMQNAGRLFSLSPACVVANRWGGRHERSVVSQRDESHQLFYHSTGAYFKKNVQATNLSCVTFDHLVHDPPHYACEALRVGRRRSRVEEVGQGKDENLAVVSTESSVLHMKCVLKKSNCRVNIIRFLICYYKSPRAELAHKGLIFCPAVLWTFSSIFFTEEICLVDS